MASTHTILILGASRGLGLGLVQEYLERGWNVIATARQPDAATPLAALAQASPGHLRIEAMDITAPDAGRTLAQRLQGTDIDILFVVAGISSQSHAKIHDIPPQEAAAEFITNAWAPPTAAEALSGLMKPDGIYVFMTSILGSLALNHGGTELYGASKAALNMLGIAFAHRHPAHPVILMHPGWVRTDMGGKNAPLDVPTSARGMADSVGNLAAHPGIHYVDYQGKVLPW